MPSTHVTNRQGYKFAQTAREHKITRADFDAFLNNPEKLKAFFEGLDQSNDMLLKKLTAEAAKIGGRVHIIPSLEVDYTKRHNDAAMAGGPQTDSSYNVLKVADLYQPEQKKVTETIVLFNWKDGGGSYNKAVEWGLSNGLRKTTPHVSFAIGEQYPRLNYDLGPNPMYVAETTGCSFDGGLQTCYVWWDDADRESDLCWQYSFGLSDGWFAFRK